MSGRGGRRRRRVCCPTSPQLPKGEVSVSQSVWERIEESGPVTTCSSTPSTCAGPQASSSARSSRATPASTATRPRRSPASAGRPPRSHPTRRRDEIAAHAAEEEAHVGLWDGFVEAAGGEIGAEPTPETAECVSDVDRLRTATSASSGACTRSRAASPRSPASSARASPRFYGIDGGPGSEYFRVHEEADARPCRGVPPADR